MINFDQLAQGVNQYTKLDYFNDGADVFGATPFRCFPQFFFYLHLPNQWDDNAGGGWADIGGVNVGGPLLAATIIAYILGAGYYFMKCEETRHIKAVLSDEVLLSYFALKSSVGANNICPLHDQTISKMDALIAEQIERDKRIQIGFWFYRLFGWEYVGYEETRINKLREFADIEANKAAILAHIHANTAINEDATDSGSASSGRSHLRKAWETTYDVIQYYSYAHWILWMISTIVLYQTKEGYGGDDAPGFFTDNATEFSQHDSALIFQTVVPFIFALIVVWKKSVANAQATSNSAQANLAQENIRAYYLDKTQSKENLVIETHRHFYASQALTAFSTFIATFIITNVAAWPIQGFVMKVCNFKTDDTTYIPTIFAFTAAAALINAGLKVYDMRQEEKKCFDAKGEINVQRASKKPSLWQFFTAHDNTHKAWYNGPGLMFGSVGLLLTRVLFNGGIGNLRAGGVEKMAREDILFIGLGVMAVFMFLRTAQFYTLNQRNEVLKIAKPRIMNA